MSRIINIFKVKLVQLTELKKKNTPDTPCCGIQFKTIYVTCMNIVIKDEPTLLPLTH